MIKVKWTGDVCQLLSELSKINEEFIIKIKAKRAMINFGEFYACAFIGDEIEIPEELILITEEIIEETIIKDVKIQPSRDELISMYKEWGYEYPG